MCRTAANALHTGKQDQTSHNFSIPLISPSENIWVDLEIYFFLTSEMIPRLFCGSLMVSNVRTHQSDSEVTVRRLGKIVQRIFFLLNQRLLLGGRGLAYWNFMACDTSKGLAQLTQPK